MKQCVPASLPPKRFQAGHGSVNQDADDPVWPAQLDAEGDTCAFGIRRAWGGAILPGSCRWPHRYRDDEPRPDLARASADRFLHGRWPCHWRVRRRRSGRRTDAGAAYRSPRPVVCAAVCADRARYSGGCATPVCPKWRTSLASRDRRIADRHDDSTARCAVRRAVAGLAARRGAAFGVRDGIGQQCHGPLGRPGGSEPVGRLGSSGSGHNARRDTRARWGLVLRESAENRTGAGGPASGQGGHDDASPTAAGPNGSKYRDWRVLWGDASLGDGVRGTTS